MAQLLIRAGSYFDGDVHHQNGPYRIVIEDGVIAAIGADDGSGGIDVDVPFLMPGLVEAHCHIFLDGGELDFQKRSAYFKEDFDSMMAVARENLVRSRLAGVTLIRDAGDRYGVNHAIRAELAADPNALAQLRSPGLGVRRPKRYGGFMARDVEMGADIPAIINELAHTADDVKIILTGIIDFEAGGVKGEPQFNAEELTAIVTEAHRMGRKTYAHCSGLGGLEVAVEAGVDSIEHGFFMTEEILQRMADRGIAWVPTFSPVHFQWANPELAPWNAQTVANLRWILDSHSEHVALAVKHGVELVAVGTIPAVFEEVNRGHAQFGLVPLENSTDGRIADTLDMPMDQVLISATSRPRKLWGMEPAHVAVGNRAEFTLLGDSPFARAAALRECVGVVRGVNFGLVR